MAARSVSSLANAIVLLLFDRVVHGKRGHEEQNEISEC